MLPTSLVNKSLYPCLTLYFLEIISLRSLLSIKSAFYLFNFPVKSSCKIGETKFDEVLRPSGKPASFGVFVPKLPLDI